MISGICTICKIIITNIYTCNGSLYVCSSETKRIYFIVFVESDTGALWQTGGSRGPFRILQRKKWGQSKCPQVFIFFCSSSTMAEVR